MEKNIDEFFYNLSWHRSVCFDTKEECQRLINALLQNNFNAKNDNRKVILSGQRKNVNISIAFYPSGDAWNDYAYCDLINIKTNDYDNE